MNGRTGDDLPRLGYPGVLVWWHTLCRRPVRFTLTVAGVAIACAAYVVLVALAVGLTQDFEESFAALGTEVIAQQGGIALPEQSRISPEQLDRLRRVPGVREVSGAAVGVTRLSASSQFIILGVEPTGFLVRACRLLSGRLLQPGSAEVMVGRSAARRLDLAVGDRVEILKRHRFTVVGVYETGRGLFDSAAVVDIGDAQRMFRFGDDVSLAFLEVAPPEVVGQVVATIADELPGLDATASDLWVSSFEQLDVVRQFARTMALVALVLAAVGIANTMTTSVLERRAELAILRAVGWARWRVAGTVLTEAVVAAAIGGVVGLGSAAAAVATLHRFSTIWFAPATVGVGLALEGLGLTVLAAVLGCVPALVHAVRIMPAAALRGPA